MTVDQKVSKLRKIMKKEGLSAWVINGTDPHDSEYVADHFKTREWISGFTGSAGTVVITMENALIWVDSRYFIQCASQIEGTCYEMMKIDGPQASDIKDFLFHQFSNSEKIGFAAHTLTVSEFRSYKEKGLDVVPFRDIIDDIWKDRPSIPVSPVWKLTDDVCGETSESKVARIRNAVEKDGASNTLVASLDDIAWILNLRASDLACTPVFYSYLWISHDDVVLFTDIKRFDGFDFSNVNFRIEPYQNVISVIRKANGKTVLNPKRINMQLYSAFKQKNVVEKAEYSTDLKAVKNKTEKEGLRQAVMSDCISVVSLLGWIDRNIGKISELDVVKKLEELRHLSPNYICPSFNTIAAFAEHGAIVHYEPTEKTDRKIRKNGLLLLDCGGQYSNGTTDMTRTVLIGKSTREQREDYTAVLKGHFALGNAVFPEGTTGHQIDILAHQFLWKRKQNYFHGTGHGIGYILGVHEGPQKISSRYANVPLKEGMVFSNEPGLYKEGRHGIRIENMVTVEKAGESEFGKFLRCSNITLCPYDSRLVEASMLTEDERKMFNAYQSYMFDVYRHVIPRKSRRYLKKITAKV